MSVGQQYQFFRNQWVHPFVAAGLDLQWERSRGRFDPLTRYQVVNGVSRTVVLEPAFTEGPKTTSYATKLPIGSMVKVRLQSGARVKGILMAVDADTVVVKPKARIPVPERRLPLEEIDTLEVERHGGGIGKAIAIGVAAGAATFLSIMLIAYATLSD